MCRFPSYYWSISAPLKPDASEVITTGGLVVPEGSSYRNTGPRRFNLFSIENDGEINNDAWLDIRGDQIVLNGNGTIFFGAKDASEEDASGSLVANGIVNGAGHTLDFSGNGLYGEPFTNDDARDRARSILSTNARFGQDPSSLTHDVATNAGVRLNGFQALTRTGHAIGSANAGGSFQNQGTLRLRGADLRFNANTRLVNDTTGLIEVTDGSWKATGSSAIVDAGGVLRIDAASTSFQNFGEVFVHGDSVAYINRDIFGPTDGAAGVIRAADGGEVRIWNSPGSTDTEIGGLQDYVAEAGGTIVFERQADVRGGWTTRLVTAPGGTIALNGLERQGESAIVKIENAGLLDVVSGRSSLRAGGGSQAPCPPVCGPPPPPPIEPIDLDNQGTVRIHAGAEFAFDVEITDYREGGAALGGGTWELLGANTRFFNTQAVSNAAQTAIMDVRVREVFGNAGAFGDLVFDEVRDENGGVVSTTDISQLDTRLVYNAANVTLGGAAKFDYFNTVEVNQGSLVLKNRHQFSTAGAYTNDGGTTTIESGAGLHVNGPLTVQGGVVSFTGGSELTVGGGIVELENGEMARRDIEVAGGLLSIAADTIVSSALVSRSRTDGLLLQSGRTWIVRDSVTVDENGDEVVTRGEIVLDIRTTNGVAGIVRNNADVEIAGGSATFDALEQSLLYQHGTLTVSDGKIYDSPNGYFRNANTTTLTGAQFLLENGEFRNDGALTVDENSYLSVDFLNLLTGSARFDGVVNANRTYLDQRGFASDPTLTITGLLKTAALELPDPASATIVIDGGTLLTEQLDGSLVFADGVFAPGQSIGMAAIAGDYSQSGDGILQIEWDDTGADYLHVTGTAAFGGKLEVSLLNGFVPDVGTSLEFAAASLFLGEFGDGAVLAPQGLGRAFTYRTDAGRAFLDVVAAPVPLPAGVWMLGAGLALVYRRRRARAT